MQSAKTYKDSLVFKFKSAKYHQASCRNALKNIDDYYKEDTIAIESEFIAMMLTLHSSLDVFAQYLNKIYLLDIPEYKVSFKGIIKKIEDDKIKALLSTLNEGTIYLDVFCNVIKHRNIVRTSFYEAFLSSNFPAHFMDIDSFCRNSRNHPEESIEYQLELQYKTIINSIENILIILE